MRVGIVTAAAFVVAASAFGDCKPKQGPVSPRVCIERTETKDGVEFVPDPERVKVRSGQRVHFHFVNGRGKLKIIPEKDVLRSRRRNGPNWSAVAKTFSEPVESKYTIRDDATGDETDPTIIIEPIESATSTKGPGRKRLAKE